MTLSISMNSNKRYAVILSGGSGSRLWPLSRTFRPKQLLSLNGELTMLQQTVKRLTKLVSSSRLLIVTNEDHKFEVKGQLADLNPKSNINVLAEPYAKNTLPAIAWASHLIHQKDPNAIIGVFPSDHVINNEAAFLRAWQSAEQAAEQGYLTLIGVKPNEPATGYGYIKCSHNSLKNIDQEVFEVAEFVEKPDFEKAKRFLSEDYLWNSGMFAFKANNFMEMLHQHQPEIYEQIITLNQKNLSEKYVNLPKLSIDYGLVEKSKKVAVVPIDIAWSDLGSWDSIFARNKKDSNNNVTYGEVLNIDTQDSLIWSESSFIATLGLNNILVIQTPDAILVCDRSRAEDIKNLVNIIKT